jgi:hypothetical protein
MVDPKSPYAPALSPSSSNIFSDGELTKPIRIKITSSSAAAAAASTASPQAEWKQVARELEADIRNPLPLHATYNPGKHGNQSPPSSDIGSPVAKQLDPHDRLTYGKIPMNESPELVSCPHCKRPIIRHALQDHVESCLKKKSVAKISASTNGVDKEHSKESNKATPNGEIAVMPPKSKKRKHEDGTYIICVFPVTNTLVAESVNGDTTPPKKKSAKRERDNEESTKKEKKKKQKPTVAKPKRTPSPPKKYTLEASLIPQFRWT